MMRLTPEFTICALPESVLEDRSAATQADTAAGSEREGALTLEYDDNPFKAFMRRIDRVLDTSPAEAYYLTVSALAGKAFDDPAAEARLARKLNEIIEEMTKDRTLGGPFARSAANVDSALLAAATPQPAALAPAPSAPSWAPRAQFMM